jgi:glycosyltransferase involved in cell wall biosynthesis
MPGVRYSVVVPVFNSASVLPRVYRRIAAAMEGLREPFEVVFVDDASTDASWSVLADIARADARVIAIQLTSNVGQSPATLAGFRRACGDVVITLDDDGQHAPEDIPRLLAALDAGNYDAVFGVPLARRDSPWRRLSSWSVNFIFSPVLHKPFGLRFTAFRAMRRAVAQRLLALRWPDPFVSSLVFQVAARVGMVRVEHHRSELPASRYSLGKLVRIPFAFFGGISDSRRGLVAMVSIGTAFCIGAATYWALPRLDDTLVHGLAGATAYALASLSLLFGIGAAFVGHRVAAFRRKPMPGMAAHRAIVRGLETSENPALGSKCT